MGDIAVRVAGLGKEYHIGSRSEQHDRVTDALLETVATPFRRIRNVIRGQAATSQHESFWALKDINFEVKHGEVVGIIGRNGAGKSTLLKILSRITEPTTGYAEVYGRVGALLEVGTGFHPELTGRENIFLNGAILGMSRQEIERKFDEIVEFAEIEKFIDTAVKHYSSGMGLRLGFAVAAHLEPEILVVDEVLAVGDSEFQKKCLGKMGEVANQGRTVLFVSHNMNAVQNLCPRSILLSEGTVKIDDTSVNAIGYYINSNYDRVWRRDIVKEQSKPEADVDTIEVTQDWADSNQVYFDSNLPIIVTVKYHINQSISQLLLGFDVSSSDGTKLFRTYEPNLMNNRDIQPGEYIATLQLPALLFRPDSTYLLSFWLGIHRRNWLRKETPFLKFSFQSDQQSDVHFPGVLPPIGLWLP